MDEKPRLKKEYNEKYREELQKELGYESVMEVPRLEKIVINSGVTEATKDQSALEEVENIITYISGQKPVITKARKAISSFTLRKGQEIGVMVTLRGDRMWYFLDKLINIVLPRTKDFRGLPVTSFDNAGNYTIGISDHTVFPEIDPTKAQGMLSLGITMVINSDGKKASKEFLSKFGFPFREEEQKIAREKRPDIDGEKEEKKKAKQAEKKAEEELSEDQSEDSKKENENDKNN